MATTAEAPAPRRTLLEQLLVNRNFSLFWAGEVISTIGDYGFGLTLLLWIYQLTLHQAIAPFAVAAYGLSGAIPLLFIGPLVGVLVDRWRRLATMIGSNIVQGGLVGILFATTFWPGGHLPLAWQLGAIYLVNFLLVTADQFFNQAGNPLVQEIVPEHDFGRAIGRILTYVYLGTVIGPSIGATSFAFFGPRWALLVNIGTFVFSTAMLAFVRLPKAAPPVATPAVAETPAAAPVKKRGFWTEFREGVGFVFTTPIIRNMLIAISIATLGAAALPVANIFFVVSNLHQPSEFIGFLTAALGLGAIVGSIIGPPIVARLSESRVFWLSLYADGIGLIAYSRLDNRFIALGLLFVLGITTGLFNLALAPLVFRLTPRAMMGRTTAVRTSFVTTANFVGQIGTAILIGTFFRDFRFDVFGATFGQIDSVLLLAGGIALLGAVYAMFNVKNPPAQPAAVTSEPVLVDASLVNELVVNSEGIVP